MSRWFNRFVEVAFGTPVAILVAIAVVLFAAALCRGADT